MRNIDAIINKILDTEGEKYTNDPSDSGGPTKWGWTARALKEAGWPGNVQNLTRKEAFDLYYARYVKKPSFDLITDVDYDIAYEVIDTGVNMGLETAAKFLQQSLNALNNQEKLYPDVVEDGKVGKRTISCLKSYLNHRGAEGVVVLLRCLNCLQGARYIELSSSYPKNERFVYGWALNRVLI